MYTREQLEGVVEKLVKFYELHKDEAKNDRPVNVYRVKLGNFPTITFYHKERETKIELLLNWDSYERPIPIFRDAYAVVGKLSFELCLRKISPQVTSVYQLRNAPIKLTEEKFNKILDREWRNEFI
jgi:hypothetical protein